MITELKGGNTNNLNYLIERLNERLEVDYNDISFLLLEINPQSSVSERAQNRVHKVVFSRPGKINAGVRASIRQIAQRAGLGLRT